MNTDSNQKNQEEISQTCDENCHEFSLIYTGPKTKASSGNAKTQWFRPVAATILTVLIAWQAFTGIKNKEDYQSKQSKTSTAIPAATVGNTITGKNVSSPDSSHNSSYTGSNVSLEHRITGSSSKRDPNSKIPELIITLEDGTKIHTGLDDITAIAIQKGEHKGPNAFAIENNPYNLGKGRRSMTSGRFNNHELRLKLQLSNPYSNIKANTNFIEYVNAKIAQNKGELSGHKTSSGQKLYLCPCPEKGDLLYRIETLATTYGYGESLQGGPLPGTGVVSKYCGKPVYGAASAELPQGTLVRVTNLGNKAQAYFLINDAGPFDFYYTKRGVGIYVPLRPHPRRGIDLNPGGMAALGGGENSTLTVRIEVVEFGKGRVRANTTWNKML